MSAGFGGLNPAAAAYAVDLARATHVITDNCTWTAYGLLFHLVSAGRPVSEHALSVSERLAALRVLLETDGDAFSWIALYVLKEGAVPRPESDFNEIATRMFTELLSDALQRVQQVQDRVRLRQQLERISRSPFSGRTGEHKMFIHLQAMARVGVLRRVSENSRRYDLGAEERPRANRLASLFGGRGFESVVAHAQVLDEAANVLGLTGTAAATDAWIRSQLALAYAQAEATGIGIVPLSSATDLVQIRAYMAGFRVEAAIVIETLKAANRSNPRGIRFHVDRAGKPAFFKLSNEVVAEWQM